MLLACADSAINDRYLLLKSSQNTSSFPVYMKFALILAAVRSYPTSADPFWLVNDHDYCANEGPGGYSPRRVRHGARLESVQVVFRHGARTEHQKSACFPGGKRPDYVCNERTGFQLVPSSASSTSKRLAVTKSYTENRNECSLGQLLDLGLDQSARLGRYLKVIYPQLREEDLDRITLYSTDTQRTMGTLSVLLAELFPSNNGSLPIRTNEFEDDIFALNIPSCRVFDDLRRSYRISNLYQSAISSSKFKNCASMWKSVYETDLDLRHSDDCLVSAYCGKAPLPNGLTFDPEVFECVMNLSFQLRREKLGGVPESMYFNNGTQLCGIGAEKVFDQFITSVNKGDVGGLYAIHDETFVCLLTYLGLWDLVWPKYAEFLSFEFYSDNKVRIVRNGRPISTIPKSHLMKKQYPCP